MKIKKEKKKKRKKEKKKKRKKEKKKKRKKEKKKKRKKKSGNTLPVKWICVGQPRSADFVG